MASLPDSSMVGADLTVQPGSNRMSPKAIDWVDGWQANPIPSAAPRHSVGTSLSGRNPKYRGYRDSYLDQSARSKLFVPGPGNHRTSRALALLDSGDNRLGTMNTGRMGDTFSCSMGGHSFGPTIGASNLRATVHGGAHLSDGEDVDGQRTAFPRSPSASMKMSAVNVRCSVYGKLGSKCCLREEFTEPQQCAAHLATIVILFAWAGSVQSVLVVRCSIRSNEKMLFRHEQA
eukprot:TRINITY_DN9806_c0_g1_i1.p1 TRINITY_DN9806_c0_g1~~TRINITY_DN9806_c0_g1_i1.p1  ORF type:complete len:232 (-),score=21.58 TRINITY_DN9806_c0_g1_i1:214-909(-)